MTYPRFSRHFVASQIAYNAYIALSEGREEELRGILRIAHSCGLSGRSVRSYVERKIEDTTSTTYGQFRMKVYDRIESEVSNGYPR